MNQENYLKDTTQRTQLDNSAKDQLRSFSKDELMDQLLFYKDLERKGHIYYETQPQGTSTLRQLLYSSTRLSQQQLEELLNCNFTVDEKQQSRPLDKYNRQKYILRLSSNLSTTYIREYNGAKCPRMKKSKTTIDLLNCKSGHTNCYPNNYIKLVDEFLKKYPLNTWHIDTSKEILNDNFTYNDSIEKWVCNNCDKKYAKSSRTFHLGKCKSLIIK